jgi:L-ascorbate metabolism protein UlaG (beta-lactamase superfamily)
VSLKFIGHACFEINADGKIIYTDPHEGDFVDKADLVLVSHSHFDHCNPSTIAKIRKPDTVVIAPADCASKISGNIKSLKPGEETLVDNVRVMAVPAYNVKRFRSPGVPYHPRTLGVGYVFTVGDKTIYHAGDTDFIPEMKDLQNIDVALLPSGDTYTMDNVDAAEAAAAINPKIAIPMHRWDTDPLVFKRQVESKSKVRVGILNVGEQLRVA